MELLQNTYNVSPFAQDKRTRPPKKFHKYTDPFVVCKRLEHCISQPIAWIPGEFSHWSAKRNVTSLKSNEKSRGFLIGLPGEMLHRWKTNVKSGSFLIALPGELLHHWKTNVKSRGFLIAPLGELLHHSKSNVKSGGFLITLPRKM